MKTAVVLLVGAFIFATAVTGYAQQEEIELTTYYPAPSGTYATLTVTGNAYLATNGTGEVGIGTSNPASLLHVYGTSHNAIMSVECPAETPANTKASKIHLITRGNGQTDIGVNNVAEGWEMYARNDNYSGPSGDNPSTFGISFWNGSQWGNALRIDPADMKVILPANLKLSEQGSSPAAYGELYASSDKKLYFKNSDGTTTNLVRAAGAPTIEFQTITPTADPQTIDLGVHTLCVLLGMKQWDSTSTNDWYEVKLYKDTSNGHWYLYIMNDNTTNKPTVYIAKLDW